MTVESFAVFFCAYRETIVRLFFLHMKAGFLTFIVRRKGCFSLDF